MQLCKALKILLKSLQPVRGSLIKNAGWQSEVSLAVENELVDETVLNPAFFGSTVCKPREAECSVVVLCFLFLSGWKMD